MTGQPPRRRRTSVTIRRSEIDVPDPKQRPSSSGRFVAIEVPDEEVRSRPGPLGRGLVLSLIVIGAAAVVGYAWLGHRGDTSTSAAATPAVPVTPAK